jgi:hypothetical protein
MDSKEKVTKSGRNAKNNRKGRAITNAESARDATLSMKINNSGYFSKKDIGYFITTFFPEKNPLIYSRLSPLSKLIVCQYVLHNNTEHNLQSFPFVFRLSPELSQLDDSYLKKKIKRKLQAVFQNPLYWLTTEYDNYTETKGKHLNGEILLRPGGAGKMQAGVQRIVWTS